jgi:hypothetical protein
MSHDPLPVTTDDLLEALEIFLREEVSPQMQGYGEFRSRVALNILGMLRREQQAKSDLMDEEMTQLATDLRTGKVSWQNPQAIDRIKAANLERLRINNPKWILEE